MGRLSWVIKVGPVQHKALRRKKEDQSQRRCEDGSGGQRRVKALLLT